MHLSKARNPHTHVSSHHTDLCFEYLLLAQHLYVSCALCGQMLAVPTIIWPQI